ncbi:Transcription factor GTE1 [Morella rubra]|uniref:Transcription factor GTE1 n=2 Tax=Morella rubra TaxID=262757 RepID=A0A6A1W9Q5_9ROSI|nr:Transcription factor GTE1 [Morella rubra]
MDPMNSSNPDIRDSGVGWTEGNPEEVEVLRRQADEVLAKINTLEKQVNEVEQFYSASDTTSFLKDRDSEKRFTTVRKQQQDASRREAAASKRMKELMNQFATLLHQASTNNYHLSLRLLSTSGLGPYLLSHDVLDGISLWSSNHVIDKPMDFSTIENKMEAKDGTGYKHVREIYADVRLVFRNAMKYNDEKDDVHVMARTLLEKFEEKWLQLLPRVAEEEKIRAEEDAEAKLNMQVAQEAAYADMARDLSNELGEFDMYLKNLRQIVIGKFRKMSTEEKRNLGAALTRLDPEDLNRALEIVAETNPSFLANAQEVDLDMDAQSEYTLWRLKVFVKDALKVQGRSSGGIRSNNDDNNDKNKKNNSKRRREICDAIVKTAVKRTKKLSNL